MKKDGFWLHDFDANVKKKVKLGIRKERRIKFPVISPDEKIIYFISEGKGPIQSHWASVISGEILGTALSNKLIEGANKVIFSAD